MVSSSESWTGYRVHTVSFLYSLHCFVLNFSYSLPVKVLLSERFPWVAFVFTVSVTFFKWLETWGVIFSHYQLYSYINVHKHTERHCNLES